MDAFYFCVDNGELMQIAFSKSTKNPFVVETLPLEVC